MNQRSVTAVAVFTLATLGGYAVVWVVRAAGELNDRGAGVPTPAWLLVPGANLWWLWKLSQGVEFVTSGRRATAVAFVALLCVIGVALVQHDLNRRCAVRQSVGAPVYQANTHDGRRS